MKRLQKGAYTAAVAALLALAASPNVSAQSRDMSRDIQIADFHEISPGSTQSGRSRGGLKANLTADDEGRFSFPTTTPWKGRKTNIRGTLEFPENAGGPVPLVVIIHSTDGINAAEKGWAKFWHRQGYATFLLDYMGPRNVGKNDRAIPRPPYDVADALTVLATHPRIDNDRVAVQGLSNGATIAVSSASLVDSMADRIGVAPKAFIMMYGGCHYNLADFNTTDAAYLFIVGDSDSQIPASMCTAKEELAAKSGKDVRAIVIPNAHHGFDGDESKSFNHPRFGLVIMEPSSSATKRARNEAKALLDRVFSGG